MPLKVNGQVIPDQAIGYEMERLVRFYSQHMPREKVEAQRDILRAKAREQAIGTKLLIDEAKRLDIIVPAGEIDRRVEKMRDQAGGRDAMERMLRAKGQSMASLREAIETGRRADMLVETIAAGVQDPTDAEMRAHYEAHAAEYTGSEKVEVQHILVRPRSPSAEDHREAQGKAEKIRQGILDGADFAGQAAAHSDCPSGKRTGGSLGWIERGMLVPAFDRAVFALEEDAISDVFATPLGYHVARKTGHKPAAPVPYEEVVDKIRDLLRHARRGEAIAARVAELKAKATIEDTPDR
jgi:parvulin-like peptidyl-prolyl isomerase